LYHELCTVLTRAPKIIPPLATTCGSDSSEALGARPSAVTDVTLSTHDRLKESLTRTAVAAVVVMFLIHPTVSRAFLEALHCEDIDGVRVLAADMSVEVSTKKKKEKKKKKKAVRSYVCKFVQKMIC
jgi:hypothetical protein